MHYASASYVPLVFSNGSTSVSPINFVQVNGDITYTNIGNGEILLNVNSSPNGTVLSTFTITDNSLIRGDGGAQGIQGSGITVDDNDNISNVNNLNVLTYASLANVDVTNLFSQNTLLNGSVIIPSGSSAGLVLTSDANGTATWQAIPSSADNLGSHIAGTNLNLNGFSLINAQDINGNTANFNNVNITTNLNYANGAAAGLILTSDANGNASWQTISNLSNVAINNGSISNSFFQDPTLNGFALFTNNSSLQVNGNLIMPNGATAGLVLTSDANGLATWQTIPSSADNLGSHIAGQNLNLNGFSLINAQDVNGNTANFNNVNITTNLNYSNGATAGFVLTSDANGNAFWQAVAGVNNGTINNSTINNGTLNTAYLQDPTLNGQAFFTANSTAQFNGNILIPSGATTGLVLTSDANGIATWQAIPSSADNLGSHIAGQNLNLNGFSLINARDVNGNTANFSNGNFNRVNITTSLAYTNGASAGFVLTSDINGNASWQAVAGVNNGTINNSTINNGTLNTAYLQDPTLNGQAFFTNNSTAQFNGNILVPNGASTGLVLTSDANGIATWQAIPSSADNLGSHIAGQNLNLNGFSLINAQDVNGNTANFTNGNFTNLVSNNFTSQDGFFNGNVGIGIASPSAELHVNGDIIADNLILSTGGTYADKYSHRFTVTAGNIKPVARFNETEGTVSLLIQAQSFGSGNSGTKTYSFQGGFSQIDTGWSRMVPMNEGRGHGQSIAGYDLYARRFDGYTYEFAIGANTTNKLISVSFTNIGEALNYTDISATAELPASSNGDVFSNRGLYVQNHIGIGVIRTDADLEVGNGTLTFIDGADDVLIADDLEVDGNAYIEGSLRLPAGSAAGLVLTSNASGLASWQAIAGVNNGTINNASILFSTLQDSSFNGFNLFTNSSIAQFNGTVNIPTGAANGLVLTSDMNGNASWRTVPSSADNLGSHIAGQNLNLNGFSLINAQDVNGNTANFSNGNFDRVNITTSLAYSNGASAGFVLTSDINGNASWQAIAGVNNGTINNGTLISSYLQDSTLNGTAFFTNNSIAQFNGNLLIPNGATAGLVLTSDANGIATWQAIPSSADNLGSHIAGQNLNLNGFSLINAQDVNGNTANFSNGNFNRVNITTNIRYTNGAGAGFVLASDINGNGIWTDLSTLSTNGDNMGNQIAVANINVNGFDLNNVRDIMISSDLVYSNGAAAGLVLTSDINGNATWQAIAGLNNGTINNATILSSNLQDSVFNGYNFFTANSIAQFNGGINIPAGSANGLVLTSDINGNATWRAIPSSADNLGSHIAGQNLNLNGFSLINAQDINGVTANFNNGNFSNLNISTSLAYTNGAAAGFILTSDINGNASWQAAALNAHGANGAIQFANNGILDSNGRTFFWDDVNGRMGIGTNTPAYSFDIDQNNPTIYLNNNGGTSNDHAIIRWNSNSDAAGLRFYSGATEVARMQDNLNFQAGIISTFGGMFIRDFGIQRGLSDGAVAMPGAGVVAFGDGTLNALGITNEYGRFDTNGNLGLATTTPSALLDVGGGVANFIDGNQDALIADDLEVDGNAYIQGNLTVTNGVNLQDAVLNGRTLFTNNSVAQFNGGIYIPGGAVQDYVLTSDINGNASWRDISYVLTNGGAFLGALNDAISDRNSNLFLGNGAGLNHTGMNNTGIGINALRNVTAGNGNTVLGYSAFTSLNSGSNNIAIGDRAGNGMLTGNGNIFIGSTATGTSNGASNELNIGNTIFGDLVNGFIAINDNNPSYDFQVNGTTYTEGFIMPTGAANGLVLVSDANGLATWQLPPTVVAAGSNGAIQFSLNGVLAADENNFFWDHRNGSMGIGSNNPIGKLFVEGGAVISGDFPSANYSDLTGENLVFDINATTPAIVSHNGTLRRPLDFHTESIDFQLGTAGGSNVVFSNTGRIGINTLTPEASLDVGNGTANFIDGIGDALIADDLEVDGNIYVNGALATSLTEGSVVFAGVNGTLSEDNNNFFYDSANGNLAIGSQSTTRRFTVNGEMLIDGDSTVNTPLLSLTNAGAGNSGIRISGSGSTVNYAINLDHSRVVAVSTTNRGLIYSQAGNGGGGAYGVHSFRGDANSSLGFDSILEVQAGGPGASLIQGKKVGGVTVFDVGYEGTTNINISNGTSEGLIVSSFNGQSANLFELKDNGGTTISAFDNGGFLGIGFSDPAYNLAVNGITYTEGLIMPTGAANGLVLVSDANGVASWQIPPTVTASGANGAVQFSQDGVLSSNGRTFHWDLVNGQMGIGTDTPEAPLHVFGTDARFLVERQAGQWLRFSAGTVGTAFKYSNTGSFSIGPVATKTDTSIINNFFMSSAGRIGIGTTSPSALFDIGNGTADFIDGVDDLLVADDLEVDGNLYVNGSLATSLTQGSVFFAGVNGTISENNNDFFWNDSTNDLSIGTTAASNANLLINTATPLGGDGFATNGTLTVVSPAIAGGRERPFHFTVEDSNNYFSVINTTSTDNIFIPTFVGYAPDSAATQQAVSFDGRITGANDTSSGVPVISFRAQQLDGATALNNRPIVGFGSGPSGNTMRMVVMANGNVGIGELAPRELLDVNGNILTDGFIMPTGAANGFVLVSDANGVASWQTPSASNASGVNGSIQFANNGTLDSNGRTFFWDDVNGQMGIGTNTPNSTLEVSAAGAAEIRSTDTTFGNYASFTAFGAASYPRGNFVIGDPDDVMANTALWVTPGGVNQTTTTLEALTNSDTSTNLTKRAGVMVRTDRTIWFSARGSGGDGNTPIYITTDGSVSTATPGIYIADPGNGQNIGISTVNPLAKLSINGDIQIRDGTQANGFILVSDINGVGSWQDPSTISSSAIGANGAIQFALNGAMASDDANFVWEDSNNYMGIGTNTPNSTLELNGALSFTQEFSNGPSGAAITVDFVNGNKQRVTLDANTTITLDAPGVGNYLLKVVQDATGSRTVTWSNGGGGAIRWPSGITPTLSTTANAIDIVSCYYDGTDYFCLGNLNFI